MATVIATCSCASPYQDSKYGKGQRVFNEGKKDNACTVCGKKGSK